MKKGKDASSGAPRKLKFVPKIPPKKVPRVASKPEQIETKEDIDKELLSKLQSVKDSPSGRVPKNDRKFVPEFAFGGGSGSSLARSFGRSIGGVAGIFPNPSSSNPPKEYVEPWDYRSLYPITLPWRMPYSGNPEILDEDEFGEASTSHTLDESNINTAEELGLMERIDEAQMIFFQFPAALPLPKLPRANGKVKETGSKQGDTITARKGKETDSKGESSSTKEKIPVDNKEPHDLEGRRFKDLPSGHVGKLLVYKSGTVKLKLGDTLFDVSPGMQTYFAQDVAVIDTKMNHWCVIGELSKRAVVTPDLDSILDSI